MYSDDDIEHALQEQEEVDFRDQLTLAAMHGIIANSFAEYGMEGYPENIAEAAVYIADAVMRKLEEEEDE